MSAAALERARLPAGDEGPPAPIQAPAHDGRVLQLDLLRGIAILGVLGVHNPGQAGRSGLLRPLDAAWHQLGWTGVQLFFVLSGYLIGGLLFTEIARRQRLDVRRFLLRRMLRIWPPYYVMLLYLLVLLWFERGSLAASWAALWPGFLHIQNFILLPRDHLWSLAVEEHFYLLLPLFLGLAIRGRTRVIAIRAVPWACLILGLGAPAVRFLRNAPDSLDPMVETWCTIDGLFFGVTLAYLRAFRPAALAAVARWQRCLLLGCLVLLLPSAWVTLQVPAVRPLGYTGVQLAYALALICVVHARPDDGWLGRVLFSRPARWLALVGVNSYSIYLWHRDAGWPAYLVTNGPIDRLQLPGELSWLLHTLVFMGSGIAGGILLGRLVEIPVQRLRDRLFPPRVRPAGLA